jgi:hypothetical protein
MIELENQVREEDIVYGYVTENGNEGDSGNWGRDAQST